MLPCSSLPDELQRWWISVFRFLGHKMRLPATLKGGKAAPVTSRRSRAQAVLSGPWLRARCRRLGNDAPRRSPSRLRPCSGPTAPPPVRCILLHKGGPSNRKHGAARWTAHPHKRKMARRAKPPKCKSNAAPSTNPRYCDSHRSGEGVAVASADVGNSHLSGVWRASDIRCRQKRWRRTRARFGLEANADGAALPTDSTIGGLTVFGDRYCRMGSRLLAADQMRSIVEKMVGARGFEPPTPSLPEQGSR
jgi:hypothetical protein